MPRKSYADYNQRGEAEKFEGQHFSGVFGAYLKASDEQFLNDELLDHSGSILDVGAGSGRLSIYLAGTRAGRVVASDASIEMLRTAAEKCVDGERPEFVLADARDLPFADNSFDYVISFRTIMHLPEWKQAIAEMCRVARKAVVLDAPARIAAPGLEALYHQLLEFLGADTKPYRTFMSKDIHSAFEERGFVVDRSTRRFVIPVKVSRVLGNGRVPVKIESLFRKTGVSKVLGGQIMVKAVPR